MTYNERYLRNLLWLVSHDVVRAESIEREDQDDGKQPGDNLSIDMLRTLHILHGVCTGGSAERAPRMSLLVAATCIERELVNAEDLTDRESERLREAIRLLLEVAPAAPEVAPPSGDGVSPLSDRWRRGVSMDSPDELRLELEANGGHGLAVLPDIAALAAFAVTLASAGWQERRNRRWVRGRSHILLATASHDIRRLLVGAPLDWCYLCPGTDPRVLEEVRTRLLATKLHRGGEA